MESGFEEFCEIAYTIFRKIIFRNFSESFMVPNLRLPRYLSTIGYRRNAGFPRIRVELATEYILGHIIFIDPHKMHTLEFFLELECKSNMLSIYNG